ncbi:hypothetical protein EPD62_007325 [Acetivibrio thermocellus]|uniref:hypothetical protein n=1 Tax=Acetivibrio thermocellus TaxID=1515 RepID=UPI0010A5E19F|nr:hypothetical protein [Acetivibrio thermocellus]THJ78599.1 hypothetical protein EPD62_05095 [Acetivibrio thermocellus]
MSKKKWDVTFYMPSDYIKDSQKNEMIKIKDSSIIDIKMDYEDLLLLNVGVSFTMMELFEKDKESFIYDLDPALYNEYNVKSKKIDFDNRSCIIHIEYMP